jgi:two-component system response regulator YesN
MELYRVLIVDDEPLIIETVAQIIEARDNIEIHKASSGKEALHEMRAYKVDLLITDIQMPFMSGLELVKTVRDLWPDCRIIILSAHADFDYAREAIELDVVSYLLKTDSDEHIVAAIDAAFRQIDNGMYKSSFIESSRTESAEFDFIFAYPIVAVFTDNKNESRELLDRMFGHYFSHHQYTMIRHETNTVCYLLKREAQENELFDVWLGETLETVQHVFERTYGRQVTFVFSNELPKIALDKRLYQMCQFATNTRDHLGYVFHYRDDVYDHNDFTKSMLDGITEYVEANIFGDLSLSILSRVTGYSASYISRFFLKNKSENLSTYISRRKLAHIRHLMRSPKLSLNDIAERASFESRSYFNRFIKRMTGMTPQEFRDKGEP